MKPLPNTLFIRPIYKDQLSKSTIALVEEVIPPESYGIILDIDPHNKSDLSSKDLIMYTSAALTTFESDGVTYHVVPEDQVIGIVEVEE